MGIHITSDEDKVAFFDSVSQQAFGPVFNDSTEAQEFLDWCAKEEESNSTFQLGEDRIFIKADVRMYRPGELQTLVHIWKNDHQPV